MKKILKQFIGILFFIIMSASLANAGALFTYPKFRATNDSGTALQGGKLYTYIAGTTANKATYSDYNLATANANPVVLNRRGEATIYGSGIYKFVLKDSAGNTIWTEDNLFLASGGSYQLFPDASVTNQDDPAEVGSVLYLLTALGTSKKAEIVFIHNGAANTTTYTVGSNADWSAYSNVTFKFMPGALISHSTYTINLKNIEAGFYQIFSGTGAITYPGKKYPEWWGAKDDSGTTDCTTAIQAAVTAGNEIEIAAPNNGYYKLSNEINITAPVTIYSNNRAKLTQTVNLKRVFVASNVSKIKIAGLILQGTGSSNAYASTSYGAIDISATTLAQGVSVIIYDNEVYDVYNAVMIARCYDVDVKYNRIHDFLLYGVSASRSNRFDISHNKIYDCNQLGAANAYGIHATGDHTGGDTQRLCVISSNIIYNIQSWAGIMSHDAANLLIVGNDIQRVRAGIDLGPNAATDDVTSIVITGNHIKLIGLFAGDTDTWAAAAASHYGIGINGAAAEMQGVTISGNLIQDFGVLNLTNSGNVYGAIKLDTASKVTITGNTILNMGAYAAGAGISAYKCSELVVTGNYVDNEAASNRNLVELRNDLLATSKGGFVITGNRGLLTGASSCAVSFTNGTFTDVVVQDNSHNGAYAYQYSLTNAAVGWAKQQIQTQVYTNADTTPSVKGASFMAITNSGATNITMFDDGVEGQKITLYFTDGNTTLVHNATLIILSGGVNLTPTANDILNLVKYGGQWYQAAPIAANP